MQSQYGTDKVKAICVFKCVGAGSSGTVVVKSQLNCTLTGTPSASQNTGGGFTAVAGRYQFTLADGPVVLPGGSTSSGDNDNNTAVVVTQSGGTNGTPIVLTPYDVTFGPGTSIMAANTVPAGVIEIDFGVSGATTPIAGTTITVVFLSCYDGTDNTP